MTADEMDVGFKEERKVKGNDKRYIAIKLSAVPKINGSLFLEIL